MIDEKNKYKYFLINLLFVIIHVFSFIIVWLLISDYGSLYHLSFITYRLLFLSYAIFFVFFSSIFDAFAFDRRKVSENVYSLSLSCLISCCLFYFLDTLAFREFRSPIYIIFFIFVSIGENCLICELAKNAVFKNYRLKKATIYYHDNFDLNNISSMQYFNKKYHIEKKIKDPKKTNLYYNTDIAFIGNIKSDVKNEIINNCLKRGIEVFAFPSVDDVIISGGKYVDEMHLPMINIDHRKGNLAYSFTKRALDILFSIISLIILSPIMLITGMAIKIYDGGPILYKQNRLTKDSTVFTIYKFRSMKIDAEKDGIARLASKSDDRITPIGKFIRAVRIDELPQLFNIIEGDMSIVGPRPERPEIAKEYEKKHPMFSLRLQVKAGLTGYAQVYGKYNTSPLEKLKMDLYYINKKSILFDIKLCLMTIKILFMKESTEAIEEGKITAGK